MFSKVLTIKSTKSYLDKIKYIKNLIETSDAIVIGGGAGLSTSAGLTFDGQRFDKYFGDFKQKYNISDMYYGSFANFENQEEFWGFWSRKIYFNRYVDNKSKLYDTLLDLVKDKNYFVITTNADHMFLSSGFDKQRLFYVQGDYGLFQCSIPCHQKTYENELLIKNMMDAQQGMRVPTNLLPTCPVCGSPFTMNLRMDNKFVEDEGWYKALERYENFISNNNNKILYLELGIGNNTPGIIKYPFWRLTHENKNSNYVCITLDDAYAPEEIQKRSLCIADDIAKIIYDVKDLY